MLNTQSYSLLKLNSFALPVSCSQLLAIDRVSDLSKINGELLEENQFLVLGEGSNTLFVDDFEGVIIHPSLKGINVVESSTGYELAVAAGENWHNFVHYCLKHNIYGLENLALIPGSVGASPVQNIGAYGAELADYCTSVDWFSFETKKIERISSKECYFGYRNSHFKTKLNKQGIIVSVMFSFPKIWQANLQYAGLAKLGKQATSQEIFNEVIKIRSSKLPDPAVLPNAGSFFKNPIISNNLIDKLKTDYPDIPVYVVNNEQSKIAAGWLIEKVGLKGHELRGAGVHDKQALVLVNHGNATGKSIVQLAQLVQKAVNDAFGIFLEPEVRIISSSGETTIDELNYG